MNLEELLNAYEDRPREVDFLNPFGGGEYSKQDYLQALDSMDQDKSLGLLPTMAGGIGTLGLAQKFGPKLALAIGTKAPPVALLAALAGGTWESVKHVLEDKPVAEVPMTFAKGAFDWGMPLTSMAVNLGADAFKAAIGRKEWGEVGADNPFVQALKGLTGQSEAGIGETAMNTGLSAWSLLGMKAGMKGRWDWDPLVLKSALTGVKKGKKAMGEELYEAFKPEREFFGSLPGERFITPKMEQRLGASNLKELADPQWTHMPKYGDINWVVNASRQRVSKEAEQLGLKLGELTPEEGVAFDIWKKAKFHPLKLPEDPELKNKFREMMLPFWKEMSFTRDEALKHLDLDKPTDKEMYRNFLFNSHSWWMDKVGKYKENIPMDSVTVKSVLDKVAEAPTIQKARKGLVEVINSPMVDPHTKAFAIDLHDLGANTKDEIIGGWNYTVNKIIANGVKTNSDWGMPKELFDGMVQAKRVNPKDWRFVKGELGENSPLRNTYVQKDIYHHLLDLFNPTSTSKSWFNRLFTNTWKLTRAVTRPASLFRDGFGNIFLNSNAEVNPIPLYQVPHYLKSFLEVKKGATPEIKNFLRDAGMAFFGGNELVPFEQALRYEHNMFDVFARGLSKTMKGFTGIKNDIDVVTKFAKYKWNLQHGMEHDEALKEAVRTGFHYGEVSRGTKLLRESIMPFATFQTKVMNKLPEWWLKNPIGMAKWVVFPWMATQVALNNLEISEGEWEELKKNMPEYLKRGYYFMMPFRDNKERLQMFNLTWWIPGIGDLSDLANNSTALERWNQNPMFTIASDFRNNSRGSTNLPIWQEWDDASVKLGKSIGYLFQNFLPTWLPGIEWPGTTILPHGIDMKRLVDSVVMPAVGTITGEEYNIPTAQTASQAIAGTIFGLKTTPVDEVLIAKGAINRLKRLESEMKSVMKKELNRAGSDSEREVIMERYQGIREKIRRMAEQGSI